AAPSNSTSTAPKPPCKPTANPSARPSRRPGTTPRTAVDRSVGRGYAPDTPRIPAPPPKAVGDVTPTYGASTPDRPQQSRWIGSRGVGMQPRPTAQTPRIAPNDHRGPIRTVGRGYAPDTPRIPATRPKPDRDV